MDAKELGEHIKTLQKALQAKEPSANVIGIMEKLKKEVAPTEELLRVRPFVMCHSIPSMSLT